MREGEGKGKGGATTNFKGNTRSLRVSPSYEKGVFFTGHHTENFFPLPLRLPLLLPRSIFFFLNRDGACRISNPWNPCNPCNLTFTQGNAF